MMSTSYFHVFRLSVLNFSKSLKLVKLEKTGGQLMLCNQDGFDTRKKDVKTYKDVMINGGCCELWKTTYLTYF